MNIEQKENLCCDKKMDNRLFKYPIIYLVTLIVFPLIYSIWHRSLPIYIIHPFYSMPWAVVWFGSLGGIVVSLHGMFVHNRNWNKSYDFWHKFSGITGAIYGIVSYLMLYTLINSTSGVTQIKSSSVITFAIAAFIFGYSQQELNVLIRKMIGLLFGPGNEQGQPSTLDNSNPSTAQTPQANTNSDSIVCPICTKPMNQTNREITNNNQPLKDFKEYVKNSYKCEKDDVSAVIEIPKTKSSINN